MDYVNIVWGYAAKQKNWEGRKTPNCKLILNYNVENILGKRMI